MSDLIELDYDEETNEYDLNYSMWEKQEEAFEAWMSSEYDIVNLRGGYRAGKSVLGVVAIIIAAMSYSDTQWIIVGESWSESKDKTFQTFYKALPGKNTNWISGGDPENSPIVKQYNHNDKRCVLVNDSVIFLSGAQNEKRFKSGKYNGAHVDEIAEYQSSIDIYKLTEMLMSRFDTDTGPTSMLWTTTTDGYNSYYDIIKRRVDRNGDDIALRIKDVQASNQSNPFLSESVKARLRRANKGKEEEGLHGGFRASDGLVYDEFNRDDHVKDKEELNLVDAWHGYCYDYGFKDPKVVLHFRKTTKGQLVIVDEFYQEQVYTQKVIEYLQHKPAGILYADHDPEDIRKIHENTPVTALKADKSDKENQMEKVKEKLQKDIDGNVGLLVDESCTETIDEFLDYKEDDSDPVDHAMDCIRYFVYSVNESELESVSETDEEYNQRFGKVTSKTDRKKMNENIDEETNKNQNSEEDSDDEDDEDDGQTYHLVDDHLDDGGKIR